MPPADPSSPQIGSNDFDHRRRPVVLVSATRSGSTLLQRMLNTHPQLTVWGEHVGVIKHLRAIRDDIVKFNRIIDRGFEHRQHLQGALDDVDELSEHINPFSSTTIEGRLADITVDLFASDLPPDVRWGFKEVRYDGEDLEFFLSMFPDARFLLLAREPADQISSFLRAPWRRKPDLATEPGREQLRAAVDRVSANWTRQYASLREFAERNPANSIIVRYDQLSSPNLDISPVFEWLGLPNLSRTDIERVLAKKSGSSDATSAWTTEDQQILAVMIEARSVTPAHAEARAYFLD